MTTIEDVFLRSSFNANEWCKSLGKNVELDCELTQSARNVILSPLDRPKSVDSKYTFLKDISNLHSN